MLHPDEFDFGDELAPGLAPRLVAIVVVAMFFVSTFGTALADTFFPVTPIELLGDELVEEQRLEQQANLWDGSMAKLFEHKMRERSRVRSLVLTPYAYFMFAYLDEAPDATLVGRDHWTFMRNRVVLGPMSDAALAGTMVNTITAMDRRLAGNGVQMHMIPIPRKSYVAREFLPKGYDGRPAVDDRIIDGLLQRKVSTADLREPYGAQEAIEIYFKLDTHWTPNGARLAGEEAARTAGLLREPDQRLGRLRVRPPIIGDTMGTATLRSFHVDPGKVDLTVFDLRPPRASRLTFPRAIKKQLHNPNYLGPVALAGTSFSNGQQLSKLLSHFVGYPVRDGADVARPYMDTLGELLEAYSSDGELTRLKHLFWETPIGPPLARLNRDLANFRAQVGGAYAAVPPGQTESVLAVSQEWLGYKTGRPVSLRKEKDLQLLSIPPGMLVHSGDGVAAVQLTGEVLKGKINVHIRCGAMAYQYKLGPGPFQFSLPWVSTRQTSAAVQLRASASNFSEVRIDKLEIVHQAVGPRKQDLQVHQAGAEFVLAPHENLKLGQRAALILRTANSETDALGLTLRVRTAGNAPPRKMRFDQVHPGASILIDLGHESGQELEGIELDWAGVPLQILSAQITGVD